MSARRLVFAALLAGACSDGSIFLSSDGLSSLVLVSVDGDVTKLDAYALSTDTVIQQEPVGSMYALGYAATLDEIGLEQGALTLTVDGAPLPEADRQFQLEGSAWTPLGVRPPALANLRVAARAGCGVYELSARSLPRMNDIPTVAAALDDHRLLIGMTSGRFEIHERDRSYAATNLSTSSPALAGFVHRGEVWLMGAGGRVIHGHPDRGFTEAPPVPFEPYLGAVLDGAHGDAPFELFATDGHHGVAHFDGTAWRLLHATVGEPINGARAGLAWAAPGLAVVVGERLDYALEITREGVETWVRFDLPVTASRDTVWSVGYVEGRGPVIGSRSNYLFERRASGWEPLPKSDTLARTDAILSLGEGAFLAGGQSVFAHYRSSNELCPTVGIAGGVDTKVATTLGTGFAMIVEAFEARSLVFGIRRF